MINFFSSFGFGGTGQTVSLAAIALALNYHFGQSVLILDFQKIGALRNQLSHRTMKCALLGHSATYDEKSSDFCQLITLSVNRLLNSSNFKCYTYPIKQEGGVDLLEWYNNIADISDIDGVVADIISVASRIYDFVIIDCGTKDPWELTGALKSGTYHCWMHSDMLTAFFPIRYLHENCLDAENNGAHGASLLEGILVGKGLKCGKGGINQLSLMHKKKFLGGIMMSSEITDAYFSGGIERLFRRRQKEKRLRDSSDFIKHACDAAKVLVQKREVLLKG